MSLAQILRNRKVLVTGGFGFIGTHLVERLLSEDANVSVYTRSIPETKEVSLIKDKVEIFCTDLSDTDTLKKSLEGVDYVFHLATKVPYSVSDSSEGSVDDSAIVRNMVSFSKTVDKIIFLSAYVVYGVPENIPINESHNLNPSSDYGNSKLAVEKALEESCMEHNKSYVILRAASCYGPYQRSVGVIPNFVNAALNNRELPVKGPEIKRDYLYISDLIDGMIASVIGKSAIYNLGAGRSYSLYEVAEAVSALSGAKILVEEGESAIKDNCLDIRSAAKELSFSPKVALRKGLKEQLLWGENSLC
jgi:nucleoside-diphosphate-sugar epimerase